MVYLGYFQQLLRSNKNRKQKVRSSLSKQACNKQKINRKKENKKNKKKKEKKENLNICRAKFLILFFSLGLEINKYGGWFF